MGIFAVCLGSKLKQNYLYIMAFYNMIRPHANFDYVTW